MNWYSLSVDDRWIAVCLGVFLIALVACLVWDRYNVPDVWGDRDEDET